MGITLSCLDAWDCFRACVIWLCILEPGFSGKLKSGSNLASYHIKTPKLLHLQALGDCIPLVCKYKVAGETIVLRE